MEPQADDRADRANEPTSITLHAGTKALEIAWGDGHVSWYDFAALRWACPCAVCRGEMGRPGILASMRDLKPAQAVLTNVQLVGYYGLQPRWADGHDTGIYAFEDLRAACPCAACRASAGG